MAIFIFLWNAERWPEGDAWHAGAVTSASSAAPVIEPWNLGSRKGGLERGDMAMLLRVRRDRGLVASGTITGEFFDREFPDHNNKVVRYAEVAFEHVLAVPDRIPTTVLQQRVPGVNWARIQGSGVRVSEDSEEALLAVWGEHLRSLGRG